jgi:hypothetical protein
MMKTLHLEDAYTMAKQEGVNVEDPNAFDEWVVKKGLDYDHDNEVFYLYE